MAHIELLNDKSREKSLKNLHCRRDPCIPEGPLVPLDLGMEPDSAQGTVIGPIDFGPIYPCTP
jgi:hypothetical protein